MKRKIALIALLALLMTTFAFADGTKETWTPSGGEKTVTDAIGRSITVPASPKAIYPLDEVTQLYLYAIAPEKMVGLAKEFSDEAEVYFPKSFTTLPEMGSWSIKENDLDVDKIIASKAEIAFLIGEPEDSKGNLTKRLDELQSIIRMPVIYVDGNLGNIPNTMTFLAEVLDMPEKGKELHDWAYEAITTAYSSRAAEVEDTKTVYFSDDDDPNEPVASDSYGSLVLDLVGAANAVPYGFKGEASVNQIAEWNPTFILLSDEDAYEEVTTDPKWQSVPAVKENRVILAPDTPYSFVGEPYSINRLPGIYYLGAKLYPELWPQDLITKTDEFFRVFYNVILMDQEAKAILNPEENIK